MSKDDVTFNTKPLKFHIKSPRLISVKAFLVSVFWNGGTYCSRALFGLIFSGKRRLQLTVFEKQRAPRATPGQKLIAAKP